MNDFLQLKGRRIVVFGVANRKSVAYHVGKLLREAGAEVVYVVRSPERCASLLKLLEGSAIMCVTWSIKTRLTVWQVKWLPNP